MQTENFIPESPKETIVTSEEELLKCICPLTFENVEKYEEINFDEVYYLNDPQPKNNQLDTFSNKAKQNKEALNAVFLIDDYESVFNKLESNEENQENKNISCYSYSTDIIQSYEKDDYIIPFFVKNVVSENNYFYPIQNENSEVVIKIEENCTKEKYKKSENTFKSKKKNKREKVKTDKKEKTEPKIFKKTGKKGPYKKKKKIDAKINTEDKCFPFSTGKGLFNYVNPNMQTYSNLCSIDYFVMEENFNYNQDESEVEKNEESLFMNEQVNSTCNLALWKFTTKKYFIASKRKKKKIKNKKKYKKENIKKKIKKKINKIIINKNI